MTCATCHKENESDAAVCVHCGSSLGLRCPNCGSPVHRGQNFCSNCGHDLRAGAQTVSPASYTPPHLADRILAVRETLVGERKHVTVMFADIVDSTASIERLDPEEAAAFLSGALGGMMDAIHRFEGTVNEVRGDGLMALFGAPIAHEDHAIRAALAALAIPDAVADATGSSTQTRVGLHSGEVLVRGVGNDLSVEYQALGPTVHLAARMETLAAPGSTLVTSDVRQLIEGFIDVDSLGPTKVKGLTSPVETYRLAGVAETRRWQARTTRGLSAFTGRQDEIEHLAAALADLRSGSGGIIALSGEAGMGKSRLVHEFLRSVDREAFSVLEADAFPFEVNTAYYPIKTLVRSWIEAAPSSATTHERLETALRQLDPALTSAGPAFAALLDESTDEAWASLDPGQRRRRTRDSVKAVLGAMAAQRPLVLVIEDLHWIDSETHGVIAEVVDTAPEASMLVLVTYRPEFTAAWTSSPRVDEIRLAPLTHETSVALLDHLVGDDPSVAAHKSLMAQRAEGTPLFLEETVRAMVEGGTLTGSRGAYVATSGDVALDIPDSVQALLAARIDSLDPFAKRVLQIASVAGEDIEASLIAGITGESPAEIHVALTHLQEREFLYQHRLPPVSVFRFNHALVREVAYRSLPRSQRRDLHAEMVGLLEESASDAPVERLALHASRGELWDKAVEYSLAAADRSISASAYREASTFLREATRGLEHLPQTNEVIEAAIDVRMRLRVAETGARGGLKRLLNDLHEASTMAREIGDVARQARLAIHHGYTANMLGETELAEQLAQEAQELGARAGDRFVVTESRVLLAQSDTYTGKFNRVRELLLPHVDYLTREIRYETMDQTMIRSVVACAHLAVTEAAAGRFEEAERWTDEGITIAEGAGRPFDRMYMQFARGKCLDYERKLDASIAAHELSEEIAKEHDIWFMRTFATPWHGHALWRAGRFDEAMDLLAVTEETARRVELPFVEAECRAMTANVAVTLGDTDLAQTEARAALDFGTTHDVPLLQLLAFAALGENRKAITIAKRWGHDVWESEMSVD